MHFRLILLTALLLTPLPALGIGYMYTGVGDDGRQHLELTAVTVDVRIDERVARTRTDQIFTNHADWEVEGIYEFTRPQGPWRAAEVLVGMQPNEYGDVRQAILGAGFSTYLSPPGEP